ncbi:receptor-transporting protein 3 [Girardinichthys multiradiatus]|uniref:receptor-transporting protein 3 n=1 Tax=Girardinichthys multiradiatus TaxID=208333 RepID=UPI001FAB9569|nr:receptor-transporting protein 3 [Girardinichthys multiradiatus]
MDQQEWTRIFKNEIAVLQSKGHTWTLEFDETILPNSPEPGWKMYIRKTSARFRCTSCRRSWPSNRVMVIFHMHLMDGQGTVKVRPLRQECNRCHNAPMVKPHVESNNIQILMENLVEKIRIKCYHENLGQKKRQYNAFDVKNPHEPNHCEGCKLGICTKE